MKKGSRVRYKHSSLIKLEFHKNHEAFTIVGTIVARYTTVIPDTYWRIKWDGHPSSRGMVIGEHYLEELHNESTTKTT